ncbi:hypothetical protein F7731_10970 [Cytobacillus depressus]|uniref:Uncharacterized protein n=1 Tax=Cytobacillus depressus TaxID=1602942 RepID=A0A6L3V6D9_9BACI|nr:hypothetical protein [Cytobacillus depressus]KAB2336032.1 hypothetical protein F7731_10970 [Cytobacillus depressus]
MGWAEFEKVKNEYNDFYKKIDEEIIRLLTERKAAAKGKRFSPSAEIKEQWEKKYNMKVSEIGWLMHQLNDGSGPFYMPEGPGELLGVVQIMQKSTVDDFEYMLTHSMQHEHGSIVTLEINYIKKDEENIGHIMPHLMLEVIGQINYKVDRNGSRGGGGNTQMSFLVSPSLPNDVNEVQFSLIPYAPPMEFPPREIILDKEVHFDK